MTTRPGSGRMLATVFVLALVVPSASWAQERVVIRGIGDATFGTTNTAHLFGGGVGINVSPVWQLTFDAAREFGRDEPQSPPVAPSASFVPTTIVFLFFDTVEVDRYATGSVRLRAPREWLRTKPFVEVGAGVAHVTVWYESNDFGLEGFGETRPVLVVGGGLSTSMTTRLALEVGYRYGRVLDQSLDYNMNKVGIGIALGF